MKALLFITTLFFLIAGTSLGQDYYRSKVVETPNNCGYSTEAVCSDVACDMQSMTLQFQTDNINNVINVYDGGTLVYVSAPMAGNVCLENFETLVWIKQPAANACGELSIEKHCLIGLPVELTSFEALVSNNTVILNWETATESNNHYFEVQRSNSGQHWDALGIVQGHGTTTVAQSYQYLDNYPRLGTNYYRLKQVDFDEQYGFSSIQSVQFNAEKNNVVFYLAAENLLILGNQAPGDVSIYNMQGQRVLYKPNYNAAQLDVGNQMPKGMYIAQLILADGQVYTTKFVK